MRRDRAGLFAFSIFRKAPHDRPRYGDSSLKGKGRLYLPRNKSGTDSGVGEEFRGATGQSALISAFRNNFVRYIAFEPDPGSAQSAQVRLRCRSAAPEVVRVIVAPRPIISKLRGRSCCSWRRLDHCLLLNNPGRGTGTGTDTVDGAPVGAGGLDISADRRGSIIGVLQ
jgi:hypothetical protein